MANIRDSKKVPAKDRKKIYINLKSEAEKEIELAYKLIRALYY